MKDSGGLRVTVNDLARTAIVVGTMTACMFMATTAISATFAFAPESRPNQSATPLAVSSAEPGHERPEATPRFTFPWTLAEGVLAFLAVASCTITIIMAATALRRTRTVLNALPLLERRLALLGNELGAVAMRSAELERKVTEVINAPRIIETYTHQPRREPVRGPPATEGTASPNNPSATDSVSATGSALIAALLDALRAHNVAPPDVDYLETDLTEVSSRLIGTTAELPNQLRALNLAFPQSAAQPLRAQNFLSLTHVRSINGSTGQRVRVARNAYEAMLQESAHMEGSTK